MFLNLLRAEWFKLSRRPMALVLLAIFLGLMLLYFSMIFLLVGLNDGVFGAGDVRLQLLGDEQIAQYRRWISFPGIFGAVFSQINSIGGICAIVLAAGALGSDYGWGTLRLQLSRQPRRGLYLAAKLAALLLVLLAGIVIALVWGVMLGLLYSSLLGLPNQVGLTELLLLPLAALRALYVMLPYMMISIAAATLGRSVLAGAAGGLIFLTFDISLGGLTLFLTTSPALNTIYNLLVLQQNINTLVVLNSIAFGLDPSLLVRNLDLQLLPHPLQATLVIAIYSAACYFAAYRWLSRRDLGGAG